MATNTSPVQPETSSGNVSSGINSESIFGGFSYEVLIIYALKLFVALIIILLLLWVSKLAANFIKKKIIKNTVLDNDIYAQKLGSLIGDIIFYIFCIFAVLIGFEIIGFDVGFIIGGLSFGIGFAFKDILSNLISGVFLLTTREFKLGDMIEVYYGSHKDQIYFGRVEEITIRYTVLRTLDMRRVVIPNLAMVINPVKTFNSEDIIRLETAMSVSFDSDLEKTIDVIRQSINAIGFVQEHDNTKVLINGFSEKGVDLRIFFYVDPNCGFARPRIVGEINKAIYDAMKKYGLMISYPHTTITVDKNDKNLLGTILFAKKKQTL